MTRRSFTPSEWVYGGVSRQVIRDWARHGSDKMVEPVGGEFLNHAAMGV